VGAGNKTVKTSAVTVADGNNGANYAVSYVDNTTSTINVRPLSTWLAPGDGQWSTPGNWDALPDGVNVLAVSIPPSAVVSYDAGASSLQGISGGGGFYLSGGTLSLASGLTTSLFRQTGGALDLAGGLNVSGSFSQTAGSIVATGPVVIQHGAGNLAVSAIHAPAISLTVTGGSMVQNGALVTPGLLALQTQGGALLNDAGNQIASFRATATGPGNIELSNTGVLDLQGVTLAQGNFRLNNIGGVRTSGAATIPGGSFGIKANSPLTIGAAGITALGDISLEATNLTSSGNMLLEGPVTSTAGAITLTAANTYEQNSAVSAFLGVTASAGVGPMVFGANATTAGNPVSYTAAGLPITSPISPFVAQNTLPVDYLVAFVDQFYLATNSRSFIFSFDPVSSLMADPFPNLAADFGVVSVDRIKADPTADPAEDPTVSPTERATAGQSTVSTAGPMAGSAAGLTRGSTMDLTAGPVNRPLTDLALGSTYSPADRPLASQTLLARSTKDPLKIYKRNTDAVVVEGQICTP
jgi:hypothetical protein